MLGIPIGAFWRRMAAFARLLAVVEESGIWLDAYGTMIPKVAGSARRPITVLEAMWSKGVTVE